MASFAVGWIKTEFQSGLAGVVPRSPGKLPPIHRCTIAPLCAISSSKLQPLSQEVRWSDNLVGDAATSLFDVAEFVNPSSYSWISDRIGLRHLG